MSIMGYVPHLFISYQIWAKSKFYNVRKKRLGSFTYALLNFKTFKKNKVFHSTKIEYLFGSFYIWKGVHYLKKFSDWGIWGFILLAFLAFLNIILKNVLTKQIKINEALRKILTNCQVSRSEWVFSSRLTSLRFGLPFLREKYPFGRKHFFRD